MTATKLDELCSSLGVRMTVTLVGYVSDADKPKDKRWPHFHWRCVLTREGREHATEYRTGIGHINPMPPRYRDHLSESLRKEDWLRDRKAPVAPSPASVLASLLSDGQSASDTFESFCGEMGYDTDSRKALETYLACQGAGTAMRRFLAEHYQAFCDAAAEY